MCHLIEVFVFMQRVCNISMRFPIKCLNMNRNFVTAWWYMIDTHIYTYILYADDLAAATVSKNHTDRVHDMVDEYGKMWRFNFNAGKSAVMVFGEERKVSVSNRKDRVFRLGHECVKEKETYDHVGIKMSIFNDCILR